MGAFGSLKDALGELARLSAGYSPEVIQQKQALKRLGEVDLRGKLLENDAKLERMKLARDEAGRAERAATRADQTAAAQNYKSAIFLESQLPSSEDPSFVGPRLEDNDMMNPTGEGLRAGYDTASEVYGIDEKMRPSVRAVGGRMRDRAVTQERRASEKFEAEMSYKEAQESLAEARARAAERSGSGGGKEEVDRYPEGGFDSEGRYGYYDRQKKQFSASDGFFPSKLQLTGEEQQSLAGFNIGLKQLDRLDSVLQETRGKFGPGVGQLKWLAGNILGGTGLDPAELRALNNMVKTTYTQAFLEGGKTLTDNEKQAFTETLPQPGDSFAAALVKLQEGRVFLEMKRRERLATLSEGKRSVYDQGQQRMEKESPSAPPPRQRRYSFKTKRIE